MTERVYTADEIVAAMRTICDWSKQGAPPPVKAVPPESSDEGAKND